MNTGAKTALFPTTKRDVIVEMEGGAARPGPLPRAGGVGQARRRRRAVLGCAASHPLEERRGTEWAITGDCLIL